MPQVINTNISSLNSQRNLNTSQTALAVSLQRLSSGLRINSAKDDAAGLAISERFTTQIRGLNQATRNANDGISLAQTGEGALAEISNNLQRIRELAVQSVNATNSNSDRAALDAEVQQRLAEINRISTQTSFNGQKILDGSFGNALFQVGANVSETISLSLQTSTRTNAIGAVATATSVDLSTLLVPGDAGIQLTAGELTVNGTSVAPATYTTAAQLATALNTAYGGTIAAASGNVINFTNDTTSPITFAGTGNPLGVTSVAARTATPNTTSIVAADFTTYRLTAGQLSVTVAGGSGGAQAIAAGDYTATTLAAAINTAAATSKGAALVSNIATDGALAVALDNNEAVAVTFTGAAATALGLGTLTAQGSGAGELDTIAATTFNQFVVTDLNVNTGAGAGTVANGAYTNGQLVTAINTAAGSTIASVNGTGVTITNDTTSAFLFGGANAATLGISTVAARTAGSASSADLGTLLAATNTATTFVVNNNFTMQVGSTTAAVSVANGTYTTAQGLVDAINTALGSNASALLNTTTNTATISASENITVAGAQGLAVFNAGVYAASGNLTTSNVLTVANANTAIRQIDSALTSVSSLRSNFGAIQNRFDSVIANLQTTTENLTASRSRILDADFAVETAALTRNQILQQAGVAMLAQANALPQNVLSLLRG